VIVSPINRESAILRNIVDTLKQIKVGGKRNNPVVVEGDVLAISFFVDEARAQLLFADNHDDHPERFITEGRRTLYYPQDEELNFAPKLSSTFAQPLYWVTASRGNGSDTDDVKLVYRNVDNLLFQSVIVASKGNPSFATNENTAIVVPAPEKADVTPANDDRVYVTTAYDIYLQLLVFNWQDLSEHQRMDQLFTAQNVIRDALFRDRYRDGNSTFLDRNVNGTWVGSIEPLPSEAMLKAVIRVQCPFLADSTSY
jgi:hypothetical protein